MRRWFGLAAALLVVVGAGRAFAQTATGSLTGVVRDDSGAVVTGAGVALTGDGATLQASTDGDGRYRITNAPHGTYRFGVTGPTGLAPFAIDALTIAGAATQDVTLRRNYADTRAGASVSTDAPGDPSPACGPTRLADSDQTTAVRTASPAADPVRPRTFTITLTRPLTDPEVRIDPAAGCGSPAASGLARYDLLASSNGSTFSLVASGTFRPEDRGELTRVPLQSVPTPVRAVRLVAHETFGPPDSDALSISELAVLTRLPSVTPTPSPTPTPTATPRARRSVYVSAEVRPRRDPRPPFRFDARGKLFLPGTVGPEDGCTGKVRITAMHEGRFAGGRLAGVNRDCEWEHDIPLKGTVVGRRGRVTFILRYQGSLLLKPATQRATAAYGPRKPIRRKRRREK